MPEKGVSPEELLDANNVKKLKEVLEKPRENLLTITTRSSDTLETYYILQLAGGALTDHAAEFHLKKGKEAPTVEIQMREARSEEVPHPYMGILNANFKGNHIVGLIGRVEDEEGGKRYTAIVYSDKGMSLRLGRVQKAGFPYEATRIVVTYRRERGEPQVKLISEFKEVRPEDLELDPKKWETFVEEAKKVLQLLIERTRIERLAANFTIDPRYPRSIDALYHYKKEEVPQELFDITTAFENAARHLRYGEIEEAIQRLREAREILEQYGETR